MLKSKKSKFSVAISLVLSATMLFSSNVFAASDSYRLGNSTVGASLTMGSTYASGRTYISGGSYGTMTVDVDYTYAFGDNWDIHSTASNSNYQTNITATAHSRHAGSVSQSASSSHGIYLSDGGNWSTSLSE